MSKQKFYTATLTGDDTPTEKYTLSEDELLMTYPFLHALQRWLGAAVGEDKFFLEIRFGMMTLKIEECE